MNRWLGVVSGTLLTFAAPMREAAACGCFTPPDPSVPVVQAGERILFSMDNGNVTAHIQIQYQGNAAEFGWLLPLPSVPTLELGVDELFNQLTSTTQPKYRLTRKYEGNCGFGGNSRGIGGFGNSAPAASGEGDNTTNPQSPLVIQASIGPYDYAVLKADSKTAMLDWLATNRYFVPAGTDAAVNAYIHPGAYFLALKLRSGNSTGDLQPVVVRYRSDLPMIPIVLTSVGAQPDMGIQVWMLGKGRAIPRNYYHTVINDALLDWNTSGANYNDVIIKATREADGRHTFVTEYAGPSTVMQKILNPTARFGIQTELAAQPDAVSFVNYLFQHGYATNTGSFGQQVLSSQILAVLARYIPEPAALVTDGVQPINFYQSLSYYLGDSFRAANPGKFVGYTLDYKPIEMAQTLFDRVVTPTLAAGALFDASPYLTRLYTTLSPEQMNSDPVFSYNPSLPDWSNIHDGTLTYHCGYFGGSGSSTSTPATLVTASGHVLEYPYGTGTTFTPPALPGSQVIQILPEEGPAQTVTDNSKLIDTTLGRLSNGCSLGGGPGGNDRASIFGTLMVMLAAGFLLRRRARG